MHSHNENQKLLQQPQQVELILSNSCEQPAPTSGISNLVARNVFVGFGTASVLYPLDIFMHKLYSKDVSPPASVVPGSTKPCRMALFASVWMTYKYAVTGATMKITTKQQSQGAKSYLLDEKLTPPEEGIEPMDGMDPLESKMSKTSGLRNGVTAISASMLFGGVEAFITQTNSNNSTLSKEQLFAKQQGRVFELPHLKAWNGNIRNPFSGSLNCSAKSNFQFGEFVTAEIVKNLKNSMRYRTVGLPIRTAKSSFQVAAFMATDAMEKFLLSKGHDINTAKVGSIGAVSTTFGLIINASSLAYTKQIISINPRTFSVDSIRNVGANILKHSGPRGLLVGSGTAVFYTAVVQAIVPPIEALAEEVILPKKCELQSNISSIFKTRLGLFSTTNDAGLNRREPLDKLTEQLDQEKQSNPFKNLGMD